MPSIVATAFHEVVVDDLAPEFVALLDAARGGGASSREFNRALMLSDRAVRDWAASALAQAQPGSENHLERLPPLGKPEDHYHLAQTAVRLDRNAAGTTATQTLLDAVGDLVTVVPDLDTEGTVTSNEVSLRLVGARTAAVLVIASELLGGENFVIDQANSTLRDLAAIDGWDNQLGPRFE